MTQEDTLAGATLHLFLLKNIYQVWRFSNYVHGSMLLLSTLILSSYSIIVVMLGCDLGGIAHGN